jgi:hypothetical protein
VYAALIEVVTSKGVAARAKECAGIARRTGLVALGPDGEQVDWTDWADESGVEGRNVAAAWIMSRVERQR